MQTYAVTTSRQYSVAKYNCMKSKREFTVT